MSLPKKGCMHYTVRCIPVMVMGVTLGYWVSARRCLRSSSRDRR